MKKIPVKTLYLLLVIGIGLIGLGIGSTYAIFTSSAEISNPISLNSNLTHTSDIIETIEVEVPAGETVSSTLNVTNSSGTTLNYAAWYLDEGHNIVIGDEYNTAAGTIANGDSTSVTIKILNNTNVTINVTLGVSSSSGSVVLGNGMVALGKFKIKPAMLAKQGDWYAGSVDKATITKITFAAEYTVTGNETESWPAAVDKNNDGVNDNDIMCYLNGTELTIVGNGSDEIYLNTDSYGSFYRFNALLSIENISMLNTSKTETMQSLFYDCYVLESIDLSGFDTSNVTNMHAMFYDCYALTGLDVSGFDTSNVTDMAFMFDMCRELTSIDVSNFDTSNVENMSHMFNGCYNLTSINMTGFDTSNVTNMYAMFNDCQKLLTLDISDFVTLKVTDMGYMFSYCHELTAIYVSDLWTVTNVTNSSYMFYDSTSLVGGAGTTYNTSYVDKTYARVDGGRYSPGYLTHANVMAPEQDWYASSVDRTSITKIKFSNNYTVTGNETESWAAAVDKDDDGVNDNDIMCYLNGTEITIVGNKLNKIYANSDSSYMFDNFTSLTNIENLNMLDTSYVTNMLYMFNWCTSLTQLDVSGFNTSNVTNMASTFRGCSALTELDLSSFDTRNVTDMNGMFVFCSKLNTLILTSFDTSKVQIMDYMFHTCSSLSTLDLSSFDISNVTTMNYMFRYDSSLTTIYVSNLWDATAVAGSSVMFQDCSNIVGGSGTTYNSSYIDKTYARVDGGTSSPGYFTLKTN